MVTAFSASSFPPPPEMAAAFIVSSPSFSAVQGVSPWLIARQIRVWRNRSELRGRDRSRSAGGAERRHNRRREGGGGRSDWRWWGVWIDGRRKEGGSGIRCRMATDPPVKEDVFRLVGVPLVKDALSGYNASILSYGQNLGCGKNVYIDMSIHSAYAKAIRSGQHYIYIENQYFIGSSYNWNQHKTTVLYLIYCAEEVDSTRERMNQLLDDSDSSPQVDVLHFLLFNFNFFFIRVLVWLLKAALGNCFEMEEWGDPLSIASWLIISSVKGKLRMPICCKSYERKCYTNACFCKVGPKTVPKMQNQQVIAAPPPSSVTENIISNSNLSGDGDNQDGEGEGFSVYLKNLPLNVVPAMVEEAFKQFGPIKRGGIQVRSNKGFCFGFVEFETLDAANNAIEGGSVVIGGRPVVIEEKKSTNSGGSRGRFPQGRGGGFRNEGARGRGGSFGRGRGYGRGEFGRGDYGNRGNGRGYQNRNFDGYQKAEMGNGGTRVSRGGGTAGQRVPATA